MIVIRVIAIVVEVNMREREREREREVKSGSQHLAININFPIDPRACLEHWVKITTRMVTLLLKIKYVVRE